MLIHHVATITLLVLSYQCNLLFIGTLITTIHNLSDIFLHCAKIFGYIQSEICVIICAALLFVSWIYSRLYIFPVYVIYSCIIDSQQMVEYYQIYYTYCVINTALITLFILHIFWFRIICLSIFRKFDGKRIEDVREKNN